MIDESGRLASDAWLVEIHIASIIDAVSLSEVINLKKDQRIMQATCIYLCARMAQDRVESIGRGNAIG